MHGCHVEVSIENGCPSFEDDVAVVDWSEPL
jgi:hypothetical protein